MKLSLHLLSAAIGAAAIFAFSGSLPAALLFFASAGLIDADHALDYFLIYKKIDFAKMLMGHFYKSKIYVLLHSFEIPILALVLWPGVFSLAFAAGYLMHLCLDLAEYRFKSPFLTYFFAYRLLVGFEKNRLCASS